MKHRRDRIRNRFDELEIDAFFLSTTVGGNDSFQNPSVRYLTGFTGSNAWLILGRDGDVFITDSRYTDQAARECGSDLEQHTMGVRTSGTGEPMSVFAMFEEALGRVGGKRLGVEAAATTLQSAKNLREKLPGVELVETLGVIEHARLLKDAEEIEALRTACSFGDTALRQLLGDLKEGMTEKEVAVMLEAGMRAAGSEGLSFSSIVAFGEQAAEPHHRPTDRRLRRGDLIKFDFGGTYLGYHADMTRTVAFGEPSSEHREIYELVRASQAAGVEAVRAGVTNGSIDDACRNYLLERGHDFGHGTGHGVGLEVHEAPGVTKGGEQTLEPGMCITIEPGIYLPGNVGVRIEDSVAVTEDGCDILTTFPKELIVV